MKFWQLIQRVLDATNWRFDDGETAILARQLEHIRAQTYDIKYAALLARRFIPVDNSVPSGAESHTYRSWNQFGAAKIITNFADDLPRIDVLATETTHALKSLGDSYGYSIQDLRASAMSGMQLDQHRAASARRAIELGIDAIAAVGDADAGLPGFTNNANVPLVVADNIPWSLATTLEILADLNKLCNSIPNTTLQVHSPDTLLLDPTSFNLIATTPLSSTNDTTILQSFMKNSPYIRNVDQWHRLTTAGAAGVNRLVAYERTPEVLQLVVSQEFEQFPPQAKNLDFVIPCHARCGGVDIRYPLAMAYMDNV